MSEIFPAPIRALPEADLPLDGLKAFVSQSATHQILFFECDRDVDLPDHAHAAQVGFVVAGRIDLTVDGVTSRYTRGDRFFIPEGVTHSARIFAGYADITFFDEPDRYLLRQ